MYARVVRQAIGLGQVYEGYSYKWRACVCSALLYKHNMPILFVSQKSRLLTTLLPKMNLSSPVNFSIVVLIKIKDLFLQKHIFKYSSNQDGECSLNLMTYVKSLCYCCLCLVLGIHYPFTHTHSWSYSLITTYTNHFSSLLICMWELS